MNIISSFSNVLDNADVENAYQKISEISNNKEEYLRVEKQIENIKFRHPFRWLQTTKSYTENYWAKVHFCKNPKTKFKRK